MACEGILDSVLCESISDSNGSCTWEGSRASGFCAGAQPTLVSPPPPDKVVKVAPAQFLDHDAPAFTNGVMWPMYAWTLATFVACTVLVIFIIRARKMRPEGDRPSNEALRRARAHIVAGNGLTVDGL